MGDCSIEEHGPPGGFVCVYKQLCLVSHNCLFPWQHFAPHSLELVPEEREDVFIS